MDAVLPSGTRNLVWRLAALLVGLLLGGFAWTHVLAKRAEAELPPNGSFVEVEGLRLRYVERGTGVPVVFLHGAYGGLEDWTATIFDDVSQRCRAIAFDRPGHGYSDRPTSGACTAAEQARLLHAAITKLGVEKPVLVGFSFSGALVLSYALQFPDDVAGVMTVNGALYDWDDITAVSDTIAALPVVGPLGAYTVATPIAVMTAEGKVANAFAPAPIDARFGHSPIVLALRPRALLSNAQDMRTLKPVLRIQSPRYRELKMPLAIVTGLGDRITGPQFHSYRIHSEVPGSMIFPVEGAGHQVIYSHGAEVTKALDALLAEVAKRAATTAPH